MQFDLPSPPRETENILPMINVVFLLLIFFLMSAELTPSEPFAVELPVSSAPEAPDAELVIVASETGDVGFRDVIGKEPALSALRDELAKLCGVCDSTEVILKLRVDGTLGARDLASLLSELTLPGVREIALITMPE